MIKITQKGDFKKTHKFLNSITFNQHFIKILEDYGRQGVEALSSATPIDTGNTAASWTYSVEKNQNGYAVTWSNTNINNGVNIAIILQYGHGTGSGGYVKGKNYINPALQPIFDSMANELWKEVTSA